MYDRTTVQGATFNMRGQLYRGHANATALPSSPVVSALGSESDDPGSTPGRGKALCPWDVREKKMRLNWWQDSEKLPTYPSPNPKTVNW